MIQKTIPQPGKLLSIFLSSMLFVVLPFIYSNRLQDVEQSPRFLIIAAILIISSVLSLILVSRNSMEIKRDKFYVLLIFYLSINFISFLRSINYGDGLFEFLKLFLFYSLCFQLIVLFSCDEKNKLIFFKTVGICSLILIAFAIAQIYQPVMQFISNGTPVRINYAIASTLGNKNFFAETLLLMLPITLLSILFHNNSWKILFIISSILIIIFLIVLQTLSTWLALFAAAMVVVMMLFRFNKKIFLATKEFRLFYLGTSAVVLVIFIGAIIFIQTTGSSQIKDRILTIQKMMEPGETDPDASYENSTYERLSLWKNSINMAADHPVAGVGLANWKIISPSYGIGSAKYMSSGVIRFVHPHNDFLLVLTESGVIGLLVFAGLLGLLIYYAWCIFARATTRTAIYLGLAMLSGLTAYIVISVFSLPSNRIFPNLLLMLFAALILSEFLRLKTSVKPVGKNPVLVVLLLTFIVAIVSVSLGNKRLRADFYLSTALLQERQKNFEGMKRTLEKIDRKYYPVDATATPIAWYYGFSMFYTGNQEKAFALFKEAEQANPNHLMVLNDLGTCYNLSGDPKTAEQLYKKALTIQPAFGEALINLSIIYFNAGKLDQAYETLVQHTGKFKPESLPVFSTIIIAKAETLTSEPEKIERLRAQINSLQSVNQLLADIRSHENGLSGVMEK